MKVISLKTKIPNYSNIHNAICIKSTDSFISYFFIKFGKIHNSKYNAGILFIKSEDYLVKYFYLFGNSYTDILNNQSWKIKVKQLKHKEK